MALTSTEPTGDNVCTIYETEIGFVVVTGNRTQTLDAIASKNINHDHPNSVIWGGSGGIDINLTDPGVIVQYATFVTEAAERKYILNNQDLVAVLREHTNFIHSDLATLTVS